MTRAKLKTHSLSQRSKIIAVVMVFAVVGVVMLALSRAATSAASVEPEDGQKSTNAQPINDAAASQGKAVQFTTTPTVSGLLQPYALGFAPFAYIPWQGSMPNVQSAVGNKNFMAAFVIGVGNSCTPAWDGEASLGLNSARGNTIGNDINTIRSRGGDVAISFGGAAGNELALNCGTTQSLTQAYRSVIERYNLTKIDLDIEGQQSLNGAANTRRADALKQLQQERPSLKIWMTLQVSTTGLTDTALGLVRQMRDKGVVISGVNLMVMDYYAGNRDMGKTAIDVANGTHGQLKNLYPSASDATIWKAIGLTPMIGINDSIYEVFNTGDAQEIYNFAMQKGIGMLSYWNTDRDKSCPGNAAALRDDCSGVTQSNWQFAKSMLVPAQ